MNSGKGLGKVISALLAASSLVGQASAARVKGPAGKVKIDKNVVRRERKKKARSAVLDVGGRERRGKAINAYASPLDNPRNWVDSLFGLSMFGSGSAALYYRNKASKASERVLDFLAMVKELDGTKGEEVVKEEEDAKELKEDKGLVSFINYLLEVKSAGDFEKVINGIGASEKGLQFHKVGDKGVKSLAPETDFKNECYYLIDGIVGGPIYRSLSIDVGLCVDYLLVKALGKLGNMGSLLVDAGITTSVLKDIGKEDGACNFKGGKCVTSLRKHLRNMCDKFLSTDGNIAGTGDVKKKNLAKAKDKIARIFDGAEAFEEALRSKFSGFAEKYKENICNPLV